MQEDIDVLYKRLAGEARKLSPICHKSGIVTPEEISRGRIALEQLEKELNKNIARLHSDVKVYILKTLFLHSAKEDTLRWSFGVLLSCLTGKAVSDFLEGELMYGNNLARQIGMEIYCKIGLGTRIKELISSLEKYPPAM